MRVVDQQKQLLFTHLELSCHRQQFSHNHGPGHLAHTHRPKGTTVRVPHSHRGPFGPFLSLAGGRASLRARPAVSRIRGDAGPLLEAGDLLEDRLRVVHDRSLNHHLRVVHVEGLGGDARAAILGAVGRASALRAAGELRG